MAKAQRQRFSQRTLDAIDPPASGTKVVYDEKHHDLCVHVSPGGRKTFYFYAWSAEQGKPIRVKLGVYRRDPDSGVSMTPTQARTRATEVRGELNKGNDPAAERSKRRREIKLGNTFADVFNAFKASPSVRTKRNRSAKTLATYQSQYDLYLDKKWGGKLVADITPEHVKRLHADITAGRLTNPDPSGRKLRGGAYQANRVLALVSAVLEFARRQELVKTNAADAVDKNAEEPRNQHLTADEAKKFFDAIERAYKAARQSKRYGGAEDAHRVAILDAIMFALYTGQRRSNVLGLRWADVDTKAKTLRISAAEFKGRRDHYASIPPQALAILERRQGGDSPFVFASKRSTTGHVTEPKATLNAVLKDAGIASRRFHDLRHTAGTWLSHGGVDLYRVAQQLGHRSLTTTQRYAAANVKSLHDPVAEAMEALSATAKPESSDGGD